MLLKKILIAVFSVLMFLPVAFFTPTMCYYAFNKEAVNNDITTTTIVTNTHEEPNYFPTNQPSTYYDIVDGNVYRYNGDMTISSVGSYKCGYSCLIAWCNDPAFVFSSDPQCKFDIYLWGDGTIDIQYNTTNGLKRVDNANSMTFDIVPYAHTSGSTFWNKLTPYLHSNASVSNGTYHTVVDGTTTTTVEKENGVVESINQALEDTFELPVFNWATDNDTHAVLETVGSYMDIDSDNAVLSLLNYWLCVGGLFLVVYAVCLLPMYTLGFMDR